MSDQHSRPIMDGFRHPRAGREMKIVLISVGLLAALAAGFVLVLLRNADGGPVTDYREAAVLRRDLDSRLELSGSLETVSRRTLRASVDATVVSVHAEPGDAVEEGGILLVLRSDELEESIRANERQLGNALLDRERKKASFGFKLRSYELDRAGRLRAVETERKRLETVRDLFGVDAVSRKDFDAAADALDDRLHELARFDLEHEEYVRMHGFETEAADRLVTGLEEEARRLREAERKLTVRSPFDGTVVSVETSAGAEVRKDAELAAVADMKTLTAVFRVNETSVSRLSPGMPVSIVCGRDSYPGTVVAVGSEATPSTDGGPARVEVEARFETMPDGAIIGSTVSGTVLLGRTENALVLPRGPYLASGGGKYVYAIRDGYAYKTPCVFGASEGIYVEVLSGLEEGDLVIVSEYERFASREKIRLGARP